MSTRHSPFKNPRDTAEERRTQFLVNATREFQLIRVYYTGFFLSILKKVSITHIHNRPSVLFQSSPPTPWNEFDAYRTPTSHHWRDRGREVRRIRTRHSCRSGDSLFIKIAAFCCLLLADRGSAPPDPLQVYSGAYITWLAWPTWPYFWSLYITLT